MTVVRNRRGAARTLLPILCGAAMLSSCGGGSTSPPGTPAITLSATRGDFTSYRVGIDSITLTPTKGGQPVALPPTGTAIWSVDLATLTDLSELIEVPALPSGTYKSATLTLDYSFANIYVNGQTAPATAVNKSGAPLGQIPVTVTFDPNNLFTVTAGKASRLAVHIDLAAMNTIDTSGSAPKVTVQPFLVMTPAAADTTPLRVRGLLVTVQTGSSDYVINTRPLIDQGTAVGAVTVSTDTNTYFNVNGTAYTGAAGLTAMASLPENTLIAAYGTLGDLSGITPGFHATAVYAGSGLESPLADEIHGVVSARSGNTLTVSGARLITRPISPCTTPNDAFYNSATVTIDGGTVVTEDGAAASTPSPASISVGQQLRISGQCTVDSSGNLTMDATSAPAPSGSPAGWVRLAPTRIWGTLNSATAGSAVLDVLTLGDLPAAGFNFAGTGAQAANPAAYGVNTGTLDESGVAAGTLVQVDGFVTPFGAAPPDFTASAIALGSATEQQLVVEWVSGGATAPFASMGASGVVVDLSNANLGTIHQIATGPAMLDLKSLPASPLITTTGADQSNLRLAIGSTTPSTGVSVFNSASAFASALASTFTGTNKLYRLVAIGQFNAASNTFVASRISAALQE